MASPSRLPSVRRPAGVGRSRPVSMIDGPLLNQNLDYLTGSDVTSKAAKRRSLLPHFARKEGGEEKDTIAEGAESDYTAAREPRRVNEESDKKAMPPPSRLGRPTSTYGASGLSRVSSVRSHARQPSKGGEDARADALAKLTGAAPSAVPRAAPAATTSGITRAPSTRLPQGLPTRGLARTTSVRVKPREAITSTTHALPDVAQPSQPSYSAPTRTVGVNVAEQRASVVDKRTSIIDKRTSVSKRVPASTSRPTSIDSSVRTHAPSLPSPASPASSTTSRHSVTKPPILAPTRPSFSTYQQHYSPAKSALPKPPLPSARASRFAAPPVTEADIPISFEESKLQIELLQLSLLHQASAKTLRDYEASAKRKLSKKQAKLKKEYDAIRAVELDQQRIANLEALDAWCHDPALLAEHLHTLSKVYTEVSALAEEGSRYSQLVDTFGRWADNAETAVTRSSLAVEALPSDWHKAHTSLALRTRSLQRELDSLPRAPSNEEERQPSSLEILLVSCKELLNGMLRELEVMTKIEKGVLAREKDRVEEQVKALIAVQPVRPWVPAWQSVA